MKTLIISFFTLAIYSISFAQDKIIESEDLDKAIYLEISNFRVENGQTPLNLFIGGSLREFSRETTEMNCNADNLILSHSDTFKLYANTESIFKSKISTSHPSKYDIDSNPKRIDEIAKKIVEGMTQNKESMPYSNILNPNNEQGTVTSRIHITDNDQEKRVIIAVSFHAVYTPHEHSILPEKTASELSYLLNK